jgi:hypothetical protein
MGNDPTHLAIHPTINTNARCMPREGMILALGDMEKITEKPVRMTNPRFGFKLGYILCMNKTSRCQALL